LKRPRLMHSAHNGKVNTDSSGMAHEVPSGRFPRFGRRCDFFNSLVHL